MQRLTSPSAYVVWAPVAGAVERLAVPGMQVPQEWEQSKDSTYNLASQVASRCACHCGRTKRLSFISVSAWFLTWEHGDIRREQQMLWAPRLDSPDCATPARTTGQPLRWASMCLGGPLYASPLCGQNGRQKVQGSGAPRSNPTERTDGCWCKRSGTVLSAAPSRGDLSRLPAGQAYDTPPTGYPSLIHIPTPPLALSFMSPQKCLHPNAYLAPAPGRIQTKVTYGSLFIMQGSQVHGAAVTNVSHSWTPHRSQMKKVTS